MFQLHVQKKLSPFFVKTVTHPKLVVDFLLEKDTFRQQNHGMVEKRSQQQRQTLEIVWDFAREGKNLGHLKICRIFHLLLVFLSRNTSCFSFLLFFILLFFFFSSSFFSVVRAHAKNENKSTRRSNCKNDGFPV